MKVRDSRFEMLRIFSMILIIIGHYAYHGFADKLAVLNLGTKLAVFIGSIGGQVGVNLFILITGYFLINNTISLKKIINIMIEVWFYSISIYLIMVILKLAEINLFNIVTTVLPIVFKEYWFATAYIILLIVVGFLNNYICSLEQEKYKKMLIIAFLIWSVIPTFLYGDMYENELIRFIIMFYVGGYIRKHNVQIKNCLLIIVMSFSYACCIVSSVFINILSEKYKIFSGKEFYLYGGNKVPVIFISISIFLLICKCKPYVNIYINKISSTIFAAYLIHDNPYIRSLLWPDIFNYVNSSLYKFIYMGFIISASILLIAYVIEKIRQYIFNIFIKESVIK
ncbi:MAG: hypothetical protein EGS63_08450 [Lachnospira sp.]|mgnify:CR=1 FL=1|nr:hypothetical protein [Lachnospira sp.]